MVVGALGISVGLLILFWPRLIKTVGSEITELDKTRAFYRLVCSAIVIVASQPSGQLDISPRVAYLASASREYLKTSYATPIT